MAIWKKDVESKCGNIPSLLLANKVAILDIVLCHSQSFLQADLDHDITQEELEAIRKQFNFTDADFTSAKTYLALENKIRVFAQHVKDEVFEQFQEKKDDRLDADGSVPIVLNTVTHGRTNCSC